MSNDILAETDPVRYRLMSAGVKCTDEMVKQIYIMGGVWVADNLVRALPCMTAVEAMKVMETWQKQERGEQL